MLEKGKTKGYKYSSTSRSPKNSIDNSGKDIWMHLTQNYPKDVLNNTNMSYSIDLSSVNHESFMHKTVDTTFNNDNIFVQGLQPPVKNLENPNIKLKNEK